MKRRGWITAVRACRIFFALAVLLPYLVVSADGLDRPAGSLRTSPAKRYALFDQGELPGNALPLHLRLLLNIAPAKKTARLRLLLKQQDAHGENYHRWLTPEQYGEQFGPRVQDIQKVTVWLSKSGMQDIAVSRGRDFITCTASADVVQKSLQLKLHRFLVAGTEHYANLSEPQMPDELHGLIAGIRGLDDFTMQPSGLRQRELHPAYTATGSATQSLSPADLATIYDVNPFYAAEHAGAQPTIAVLGTATPSLSDFRAYKKMFNLPPNDFRLIVVPGSTSSQTAQNVLESAVDLEIAGGIAPATDLLYVQHQDIFEAAAYVIDNRLADVVSMSYTVCELPSPNDLVYEELALQGMAEGITWVSASGDTGAAGCDTSGEQDALFGLAVNLPASLPEVTGVGGTRLMTTPPATWSQSSPGTGSSATSYLPEEAWNGEVDRQSVTASGGGSSKDFYKPGFQASIEDNVAGREVPDISMVAAEAEPDYLIVSGGFIQYIGGTSAAAPLFAGMTALINQYLLHQGTLKIPGLGNINPVLYRLAQVAPDAFHDITTGTNKVACSNGALDCSKGSLGYDAGIGYDMVSGLGSIDAWKIATLWTSAEMSPSTITLNDNGDASLTAIVRADQESAPGTVLFSWSNSAYSNNAQQLARVAVNAGGNAATSANGLPGGVNVVTAVYEGTTSLLGSVSESVTVNVSAPGTPVATVNLVDVQSEYAEGEYLPLAATVAGTLTAPTGSINFFLADHLIASAVIADGLATALPSTLPAIGTTSLTAHYGGDNVYAAAVSASALLTVIGATVLIPPVAQTPLTPDFTIVLPVAMTLPQGQNGSFSFTVAPLNGFASVVTLSCSGIISGYGCSLPPSVTPAASTTLLASLQTVSVAFFPLGSLLFFQRKIRLNKKLLFSIGTLLVLLQAGCGVTVNPSRQATTTGTYPVTIKAVSGKITHSAVILITVE